jgi:OOP family OmpA-OmpF porin
VISKKLLAAAALAACSAVAQAAQVGPYIGGAFGFTVLNVDCDALLTCDDSDVGYKLYGGYNFTPMFGVQVDYIDFGAATWTGAYTGTKYLELSSSLIGVSGVVNWDFSKQWAGAAKLGLAKVTVDSSGLLRNGSQSNTKLYGGFDATYAINPKFKLHAGWDFSVIDYTYPNGVKEDGGVHLFSVGASYSF